MTDTIVRIAPVTRDGRTLSLLRVILQGNVADNDALSKVRGMIARDHSPASDRAYLNNCIDLGNYSIERTAL